MQLSLIIPLYNEEESLEQLHREICDVVDANRCDLEIIFVDDGSTDQSWAVIERMIAKDPRVHGIQFRRNFGKAAALQAGFKAAHGDIILTLDADLQDDPQEIPDFLRLMDTGLDVVSGWKQQRHDPWHKVFPSRVFNAMVRFMTGVKLHDHNCGMKCYHREVLEKIALYGERHRFVPVLAAAQGYKVGEKVVAHRARRFGYSKYGFTRFVKGFLDLLTIWFLTKYGQRPQHLLGTCGLIMIVLGIIGACGSLSLWFLAIAFAANNMTAGTTFAICCVSIPSSTLLIVNGIILIALGLFAELIVTKTIQPDQCYSVKASTVPQSEG